jgi:hypothetical protein
MEKVNFVSMDPKFLAVYAFNKCMRTDYGVQERFEEGCGFFVFIGKNPAGEMTVVITAISPVNVQAAMA